MPVQLAWLPEACGGFDGGKILQHSKSNLWSLLGDPRPKLATQSSEKEPVCSEAA